jgi:hypothetical protein
MPHHRRAAQAGNADHTRAVHGHEHVEEIGLHVDPLRLSEPHNQAQ